MANMSADSDMTSATRPATATDTMPETKTETKTETAAGTAAGTASRMPQMTDIDSSDMGHSATSSQQSIPSTEGPASPADLNNATAGNAESQRVIPSSLTPPPSTQLPLPHQPDADTASTSGNDNDNDNDVDTHRSPLTTAVLPPATAASEYLPPTPLEISNAPVERVRHMLHASLAENARLKMETAHHKLQYNLLSMQADEDAKRAAVEHEITRKEVHVLRLAEDSRLSRRELDAAAQASHAKYLQLKVWYDDAVRDNDSLHERLRRAKKLIQQKEDEILGLADERNMLLNRIRENREHFHMLCSPGGAFHGALTPKSPPTANTTPQQQYRTTPRQTPKSLYPRDIRHENDPDQAGVAVLLQALSHDNNSAPSTPLTASRPAPRIPPKHTRGVQSLSSLPTTPAPRARGADHPGLLPSVNLVPQSEPVQRHAGNRAAPETPTRAARRKSRESTISADDNEELARAALESVAAATQSFMSQGSRRSQRRGEDEEVSESQASQAASEMLRRDPREPHFEVASSVGSRDGTPVPAEKTAKLQSKLFAGVNKAVSTSEKRKLSSSGGADGPGHLRRDELASPTKKMRHGNNSEAVHQRVGLGIRYGQEA